MINNLTTEKRKMKRILGKFKVIGLCFALLLSAVALPLSHANGQGVTTMKSSYNLTSDTTVNTGTSYLQVTLTGVYSEIDLQFVATKISGTVAGTVSILGSLDNVNFKALTVKDATTAIPTFTATDVASQVNTWRISGTPCKYIRISWVGAGTMSAKFTGLIMGRNY